MGTEANYIQPPIISSSLAEMNNCRGVRAVIFSYQVELFYELRFRERFVNNWTEPVHFIIKNQSDQTGVHKSKSNLT